MQNIHGQTLDAERALYGIRDAEVRDCRFEGPADGESALKECRNIGVYNCDFQLRYPLWHVEKGVLRDCRMSDTCRAALWYDRDIEIEDSILGGIKAVRECDDIRLRRCQIVSQEFGWLCRGIELHECSLESEYPFLQTRNLHATKLKMRGKYSFQYLDGGEIRDSELNTKDAFWHSRNVTVTDSVVAGEYLGWYSENLTLVRCKISGTQPLCYARGLKLIDCTMEGCDLSFEKTSVEARIFGRVDSIKNPNPDSHIEADEVGEWIAAD